MARKRERAHSTADRMQMMMIKESNPTVFFFTDSSSSENIKNKNLKMHNHWQRNQTQYSFPQTLLPLKISIIKNTSTILMLPKLSMNPDHRHQSPILIHIPHFFSNGSCKNNFFHFFPCLNIMRLKLYNFVLDFWGQDSCLKLQAFSDFGLQDLKCWFLTPWLLFQHTQIQHTLAQLCEMEWGCPSGWGIENSRINALLLEKKNCTATTKRGTQRKRCLLPTFCIVIKSWCVTKTVVPNVHCSGEQKKYL